jgi:GMP synthase-like glutamine amidotransferase
MRVHTLQHVPFEGLGRIEAWLAARSATITATRLYESDRLPPLEEIDWVIALGGPMSANDEDRYPWLCAEKRFLREAVESSKGILGICLGAQLLASALGAKVFANRDREVGWLPIEPAAGAPASRFAGIFGRPLEAFHWHGETFDLPPGALHLARSAACEHQAFSLGDRVLGLQFHLETTPEAVRALAAHCPDDLRPGPWVQSSSEMLGTPDRFRRANEALVQVLDRLEEAIG